MPDLPKYDGLKDPQEHGSAFDLVMNLYGQSDPIKAKLFITTLMGKAQEWFMSLPPGSIESHEQLVQKFIFHFASKRKQKRSATYLFTIRQKENETLKNFMGRFNNETLEVQDLRIDMMVSILIHGLKKGPFALALARDPPTNVEQLMRLAQKYINEEEMNAMKDGEWLGAGKTRDREPGKDPKQNSDRVRDLTYRPKYHRYTPLNTTRTKALLTVEKSDMLKWPRHTRFTPAKKYSGKYCKFHRERGHDTEECYQLKDEIERLIRQGYFRELVMKCRAEETVARRSRSRSPDRRQDKGKGVVKEPNLGGNAPVKGVIYTIAGGPEGGDSRRSRKRQNRNVQHNQLIASIEPEEEITFEDKDVAGGVRSQNDPMVIKLDIANFTVRRVLIDNGSSADIILWDVLVKMGLENAKLEPVRTPLVGFGGTEIVPLGTLDLPVSMGEDPRRKTLIKFLVVDTPFAYNVIFGRPGLNAFRAIVSTYHLKVKFPTRTGIGEVVCDPEEARKCYNLSLKKGETTDKRRKLDVIEGGSQISDGKFERIRPAETHKVVEVIQGDPSKTTRIGSQLGEQLETMMISLLRKNADIFAWSSSDFVGVAPDVIVHRLNVDPTMRPVQQKKRNFSMEKNQVIREEVDRLLNAGYIMEVQYTNWLSNVVVVPKPGGKWRVCIDFTDLNKACPKDPYPLPRIDALVDSTAGYELFSMMDAYQGYHQIFMAEEDQDKISFVTERGIYCYKVMPFGLKNAGATYQRLVNRMFEDQIGKTMEVYVDDMLVKSSRSQDHIAYLEQTFATLRKYRMKLNPMKCTFGVAGGKFLGYLVSERGIEMNPEKIEAILKLKSPTNIKEVQKLTGKLASLNRFISKSSDRNLPFFKVLRKTKNFEWTEECEQAFQDLKTYLRSPPLLANPKGNEVLYVYLAVSENAISSALVREEGGVQSPIYYVSKMLHGAEKRYAQIEKLALALIVTARKLRPYFQGHRIIVLTNHPLRNVLARPEASGRLVKWAVELGEFDIEYQARTALKGQVLADFMVEFVDEPETEPSSGKWMLHVDGSSNAGNGRIGILIQGPENIEIEVVARLSFPVTNNEAEYEALIMGLELSLEAGAKDLEVFTDSQLVALQIEGTYETREERMILYHTKAKSIMSKFNKCQVHQIPRHENDRADSLSKFGATLSRIKDRKITVMIKETSAIAEVVDINTANEKPSWKDEIVRYLRDGILPADPIAARRLKMRTPRFTLINEQLYKRTVEGPLLKCLDPERAEYVMREIHEGSCGNHSGGSLPEVRSTDPHTSAQMEPVKIACPFDQWGIDILGPFPTARSQKKFIVVAVEYFSKWVEAEAVAKVTEGHMIEFIWKNIICRFGVPRILISDNGTQFQGKKITSWCKELKIQQHFTAVGHPQSNGQVEVVNRTILQHLKTRLNSKGSWLDELPGVLWAYRTTPRSSTGETPFCLVFGTEALIPAEIGEESHRVAMYDPATNREERCLDLEIIEEKREIAYAKILHHKNLMMRSYNKNLRPRQFQVGDLVLKKVEVSKHVGKLDPGWEGPYKVTEIKRRGTYRLQDLEGRDLPRPWNVQNLKKFYA
ncbi:UNVERIFIED_CONTAM: Retrovirus-related Pol polyprotein from transposon [Sesamum indicum]